MFGNSRLSIEKLAHIVVIFISLAAPAVTMLNRIAVQNERLLKSEHELSLLTDKCGLLKERVERHEQEIAVLKQIVVDRGDASKKYDTASQKINEGVLDIWKRLSANSSQIQSNRADIEVLKKAH